MDSQPASTASKVMFWAGWILSILPVPLLCMSAYSKFMPPPDMEQQLATMGWTMDVMFALGVVELVCMILYLIPQTAVLGAVLLTGYLGGAAATHVRVADWSHAPIPVVLGVVCWLGLFLRDPRIRELLPIRFPMKSS